MTQAHLTKNGFYVETVEANEIAGEGTFTPLPDYNPETEVPRFLGVEWAVVPLSVRDDYEPPKPPGPSDTDINAERDRRLGLGITFAGHPYQTDEISRQRINTSRISAMAAIMGGAQPGDLRWPGVDKDFFWIAADDERVPMDAQTMVAFGNAVAAREGLLIVAGNDLKQRIAAGEAISNIGDDKLWPAA